MVYLGLKCYIDICIYIYIDAWLYIYNIVGDMDIYIYMSYRCTDVLVHKNIYLMFDLWLYR